MIKVLADGCRADSVHRARGGACLRISANFFYLMEWLGCSCPYNLTTYLGLLQVLVYEVCVDGMKSVSTYERQASIKEFYAIIYPSLQQIENLIEGEKSKERGQGKEILGRKRTEYWNKISDKASDREDECGIFLEICAKMVLAIDCFQDWNVRSQSFPFCRGSLKSVNSRDLWVLTSNADVLGTMTLEKEDMRHLYCCIDSLPLIILGTLFFVYYDYVA